MLPDAEVIPGLAGFLPGLGRDGDPPKVPEVLDGTDGQVHLFGLGLSSARQVIAGDRMSTHCLVSFALVPHSEQNIFTLPADAPADAGPC